MPPAVFGKTAFTSGVPEFWVVFRENEGVNVTLYLEEGEAIQAAEKYARLRGRRASVAKYECVDGTFRSLEGRRIPDTRLIHGDTRNGESG